MGLNGQGTCHLPDMDSKRRGNGGITAIVAISFITPLDPIARPQPTLPYSLPLLPLLRSLQPTHSAFDMPLNVEIVPSDNVLHMFGSQETE